MFDRWSACAKTGGLTLALLLPAAAQTTWSVDDSGGADFAQITDAIASAAVQDGDVLLVLPGTYQPFTLDRELSVIGAGAGQPQVLGTTLVQSDAGATLAGLRFLRLHLQGSPGTLRLDGVTVSDGSTGPNCTTFLVEDCDDVVLQGCALLGKPGDFWCESEGLRVVDSRVVLTGCTVRGGDGWGDSFTGYDGRPGIEVEGGGVVLVAATDVTGGDGGSPDIIFDGEGGDGASAITIAEGAQCTVRGNGDSPLLGGAGGWAGFPGSPASFAVWGSGELTISGVPANPPGFSFGLVVTVPSPAQPFLDMVGDPFPGETVRLNVYGEPGPVQWLLGSLVPAQLSLPALVEGTIHLAPTNTFLFLPSPGQGQEVATSYALTIPTVAGLEGITAVFQLFTQGAGAGGTWLASNPAQIVVR